jgi:hypothetical protein
MSNMIKNFEDFLNEESKGLWHNIRAKRARGEKPARKGSKAYKKAVAAAKRINQSEAVDHEGGEILNELRFTSAGIRNLLYAIYYNWDKLKTKLEDEHYFQDFKHVMDYLKNGDQEEQTSLENFVKSQGVEIVDFEKLR